MGHIRLAPNGRSPISITPRNSCVGYLTIAKPPRSWANEHGGRSWRSTGLSRRRHSFAIVSRRSERMCQCATPKSRLRRHSPVGGKARAPVARQRARGELGRTLGPRLGGRAGTARGTPRDQALHDEAGGTRRAARRGDHRIAGRRRGATRSDCGARGAALETGIASFGCRGRTRRAHQGNRRCARQPHQARPTTPRSARPQRSVAPAGTRRARPRSHRLRGRRR